MATNGAMATTELIAGEALQESRKLVERIARATDLPASQVIALLLSERADVGSTVRAELQARSIKPHVWSDELVDFYRESHAMMFESVVWNRNALKLEMRQWIIDYLARTTERPWRIFTFGDGLGFDSLALAQAGHQVDYYELSDTCFRFAGEMFAEAGVSVGMIDAPEKVALGEYDAVVCLDVLEHVPDPREVVEFLAGALRPGGSLLVNAPFFFLGPTVQTHLKCNQRYSGEWKNLYGQFDLQPLDAAPFWNPLVLTKVAPGVTSTGIGLGALARFSMGKVLLGAGKYWSAPYAIIAKGMLKLGQRPWPELVQLQHELRAAGS